MAKKRSCDFDRALGNQMANLRKKRGLSTKAVAKLLSEAGDGVSYQQVQKYEYGQNRLSAHTVFNLSRIFGVSMDEVIGDVVEPRMFQEFEVLNEKTAFIVKVFNQIQTEHGRALAIGLISLVQRLESKR